MPDAFSLENVQIATPCPADWNAMQGDERSRFCGQCQLNVYNLSGMTRQEAEDLLRTTEGGMCIRMFKRADGTILTKDCPVGLNILHRRKVRNVTRKVAAVLVVVTAAGLFTVLPAESKSKQDPGVWATGGRMFMSATQAPKEKKPPKPKKGCPVPVMGALPVMDSTESAPPPVQGGSVSKDNHQPQRPMTPEEMENAKPIMPLRPDTPPPVAPLLPPEASSPGSPPR